MTEVEILRAELENADRLILRIYQEIVFGEPPRWPSGVVEESREFVRRYAHQKYNPIQEIKNV
jgi:hypothetical protein